MYFSLILNLSLIYYQKIVMLIPGHVDYQIMIVYSFTVYDEYNITSPSEARSPSWRHLAVTQYQLLRTGFVYI